MSVMEDLERKSGLSAGALIYTAEYEKPKPQGSSKEEE